ncbi:acyl-CoA dehydrogenase family protein [Candidatus Woesearchaeota archaeon]|nr:acyl-CoA dehydrogenase family protein [Candidatus Woesearchaeota archaeon]
MTMYRDNKDLVWTIEKSGLVDDVEEASALLDSLGEIACKVRDTRSHNDRIGSRLDGCKVVKPEGLTRSCSLVTNAGYSCLTIKEGGPGLSYVVSNAVHEIIARADASVMVVLALTGGVADTIETFGTPEAKTEILPKLVSGEYSGAMCLTEPEAGSDLSALKTVATKDGNGYRISGEKIFISSCDADVHVVLARDGNTQQKSMYLVMARNNAVCVERVEEKCGLHASPTGTVVYDDSKALLLGESGKGMSNMFRLMGLARLGVAAQAIGACQEACSLAFSYAEQRKQFKTELVNLPGLRPVLDGMKLDLVAARALLYHTSNALDKLQKTPDKSDKHLVRRKMFLTKMFATEHCYRAIDDALQVHGGSGYMKEQGIEQLLRDARVFRIYEGTTQIQEQMFVQSLFKGGLASLASQYADAIRIRWDCLDREILRMERRIAQAALRLGLKRREDLAQYCAHWLANMAADALAARVLFTQSQHDESRRQLAEQFTNYCLPRFHSNEEALYRGLRR